MREPKKKEPANTDRRTNEVLELKQETRRYRFLTYVMGGGVKVDAHNKYPDERTPIRAASIRGQLRFWWRACNPQNCKTIEELRDKEAEIWGSAERPSAVKIAVHAPLEKAKVVDVYEYATIKKRDGSEKIRFQPCENMRDIAYAAFPLRPIDKLQRAQAPAGTVNDYAKTEFSVRFTYPVGLEKDIEIALWAWETFGGLGARTRRGFGAIENVDARRALDDIRKELAQLNENPVIDGVPSLRDSQCEVAELSFKSARQAWGSALEVLQSLRQGRGIGRNLPSPGSQSPAGRSRWPEPEAIRKITKQRLPRHQAFVGSVDTFPRAFFGLPIIFHFQDGAKFPTERGVDPADVELKPANGDRMASPLILRPIRDGEQYRAIALKLNTTLPPGDVVLKTKSGDVPVKVTLSPGEANAITPLAGNPNPLERFLEEFKK